jgi:hypothetical protein
MGRLCEAFLICHSRKLIGNDKSRKWGGASTRNSTQILKRPWLWEQGLGESSELGHMCFPAKSLLTCVLLVVCIFYFEK